MAVEMPCPSLFCSIRLTAQSLSSSTTRWATATFRIRTRLTRYVDARNLAQLTAAQDPKMQEDTYERTFEQNEELGLNDIKVRR